MSTQVFSMGIYCILGLILWPRSCLNSHNNKLNYNGASFVIQECSTEIIYQWRKQGINKLFSSYCRNIVGNCILLSRE